MINRTDGWIERRFGLPLRHPAALIATGCGIGLLPSAPGTWGSLAALPCAWAISALAGRTALARRRRSCLRGGLLGICNAGARERAQGPRLYRRRRGGGAVAGAGCRAARLAGLSGRLPAVPGVRHLEAVAGARDRAPSRGRARHHARRCRGGALRSPSAVDRRRSASVFDPETLALAEAVLAALPGARLAPRNCRIVHRRARRGGIDRDSPAPPTSSSAALSPIRTKPRWSSSACPPIPSRAWRD